MASSKCRAAWVRNETWRNIFVVSSAEGASVFLCQDSAAFAAIHGARKSVSRCFETALESRPETFGSRYQPCTGISSTYPAARHRFLRFGVGAFERNLLSSRHDVPREVSEDLFALARVGCPYFYSQRWFFRQVPRGNL